MQEYPEDYLSTVEYNSKNCWVKTDNRVQSDEVWCIENRLPYNKYNILQQWSRLVFQFGSVLHNIVSIGR